VSLSQFIYYRARIPATHDLDNLILSNSMAHNIIPKEHHPMRDVDGEAALVIHWEIAESSGTATVEVPTDDHESLRSHRKSNKANKSPMYHDAVGQEE
jgi:hypothetical protein